MQLNKTAIIISTVVLIGVFVLGWYLLRPQGSVEFAIAPQEVTLTIKNEGQPIKHEQVLNLAPGIHQATFTAEGFETATKTIAVEDGKKIRFVLALTPLTDDAKKILSDNAESQKVIKEYEKIRYDKLVETLPLSGVNYSINACPSVKYQKTGAKALCIITENTRGEQAAKDNLRKLGYNPDNLEILVGTEGVKSIVIKDNYRIDHYSNVKQEVNSEKMALFITPLNVPFVPYSTEKNPQLEAIKSAALEYLSDNGYQIDTYAIYYSNVYLSQYNNGADVIDEHAMPPYYP